MLELGYWFETRDGDPRALALMRRHYSWYAYKDGREHRRFVGPGERMVLLTTAGDALFVWRRFRDESGQLGVNCAVFRNEGPVRASLLVREADALADARWPGERHYTYVNSRAIKPTAHPGWCFLKAGWRPCGVTKKRAYVVLERLAPVNLPAS